MRCCILLLVSLLGVACADSGAQPPPEDTSTTADLRRGRAVYMTRCQFCHGKEADGNGPLAETLPPPEPRDFRDPSIAEASPDSLAYVIRRGGAAAGLSASMPAWEGTLTAQEVDDVVAFIQAVSRAGHVPHVEELREPDSTSQ